VRSKERELRNLTQTSSVASYLADFSRIKGFVKWNDEALASQFYKGLKPAVKDGLVYENPAPTTLTSMPTRNSAEFLTFNMAEPAGSSQSE
jgi:hypothetical protein